MDGSQSAADPSDDPGGVNPSIDPWLANLMLQSGAVLEQWSTHFEVLGGGLKASVRSQVPMDTMSVIKVPILLHLLEAAHQGGVDLGQRITVTRDRKRLGTGVLSTLDDGADITLRDAAVLMITVSDNTASDIVLEAVGGPESVNAALARRGLSGIRLLGSAFDWFKALATSMDSSCAGYSPEELFVKGYPIPTGAELRAARARYHFGGGQPFGLGTASDFGELLASVEERRYSSPSVCDEALHILTMQLSTSRIPRYLPPSTSTSHKAGDFAPFIANDVGIIRPSSGPAMILCMFSAGHTRSWGFAEEVISRVAHGCSQMVHEFTS